MTALSFAPGAYRERFAHVADVLAIIVALALPWSTSVTGIAMALWFIAIVPTLEIPALRRELLTPAGGLPVALFVLGAAGLLWADVSFSERLHGLDSFLKFLAIPFLLVQFRRSDRGEWVFAAYLAACTLLLLVSAVFAVWPQLNPHEMPGFGGSVFYGVPVRSAATQSGEFVTCAFGLLYLAIAWWRENSRTPALFALVLALAFFADIFYIALGRTALVIIPVLLVLLALRNFSLKSIALLFLAGVFICIVAWFSASNLRNRTLEVWTDLTAYEKSNDRNSSSERLEFWKKSLGFIESAPLIGHGTGAMPKLFAEAAAGQSGASASATTNPHNQTLAVGIQLGLLGVAVLWTMWIAHLFLFRGSGLIEWIGLVVVVQNIVGSLFNSHLFDFVQGWTYVVGVGVAGGIALRRRAVK